MNYRIKVVHGKGDSYPRYYPQYRKWYGYWKCFPDNYWASDDLYFNTEQQAKVFIDNDNNKEDPTYLNY